LVAGLLTLFRGCTLAVTALALLTFLACLGNRCRRTRQIEPRCRRQFADLDRTAERAADHPRRLLRLVVGIGAEPAFEAMIARAAQIEYFHEVAAFRQPARRTTRHRTG